MKTGLVLPLTFSLLIHLAMLSVVAVYGGGAVSVPVEGVGYIEAVIVYSPGKAKGNLGEPIDSGVGESAVRAASSVPARLMERIQPPESAEPAPELTSPEEGTPEALELEPEKAYLPVPHTRSEPKEALKTGGKGDREEVSPAPHSGAETVTEGASSPSAPAPAQAVPFGSAGGHPGWDEGEAQPWAAVPGIEKPEYPRRSRERGEQGRVVLVVEVSSSGEPEKIKILRSSGHKRLDRAAVRAVERSKFTARYGTTYRKIAFNFMLEETE